jgi:ATP-dependent RNA helicase RhlE
MTFDDFEIDPRCLSVLHAQSIETPTPVQEQTIPVALTGKDVIGVAQTGTGKTLAFTLPSLTRLAQGAMQKNMMLVLAPTRELCQQVENVVADVGRPLKIKSVAIYGGVGMQPQIDKLKKGRQVIVATPGRLLDHMGRGNVRFEDLEILVMDEADRMLDMGFLPDIKRILAKLPKERQTLMFSATFPDEITRLARDMMKDAERISVGAISRPVDTVDQRVYPVWPEEKLGVLVDLLETEDISSAVIFLRTKDRTERVSRTLRKRGINTATIHGDRSQSQRQQALDGFRAGDYKFLVATDVAARGLDIEGVSHVINYDIPPTADDYLHRVGRTARASAEGDAITFVCPNEVSFLEAVERALEKNIPRVERPNAPSILSLYHAPGKKGTKAKSRRGGRRGGRMLRRR